CAGGWAARVWMRQLESLEQRVERRASADTAECVRRVALHAPEFVVEQRIAERSRRLRAALGPEFASGSGAADSFGRVAQLELKRLASAFVLERFHDVVLGIETHRLGSRVEHEIENLFALLDLDAMPNFAAV